MVQGTIQFLYSVVIVHPAMEEHLTDDETASCLGLVEFCPLHENSGLHNIITKTQTVSLLFS